MSDATLTMTRYLLGELTEGEMTALEEAYFGDPGLFAQMIDAENALVDDYVRGRLAPERRVRFEQVYLTDPRRRARVTFAAALAAKIDRAEPVIAVVTARSWLRSVVAPGPVLRWSAAALLLLAMAGGGVWLVLSSRLRQEEAASGGPTVLAPVAPPSPTTGVAPGRPPAPAAAVPPVVLALEVGPGVRGIDQGAPVTLVVPFGTSEVRLDLNLGERDYSSYRVLLRAAGGAEVVRRDSLTPAAGRFGPALTLTVPAGRLVSGDYVLTIQGARGGEYEDLSQSLLRVDRR